jgi:hypothetical protein
VLAVKDEGEDTLAACGGLRSLTAACAAIAPKRGNPAPNQLENAHDSVRQPHGRHCAGDRSGLERYHQEKLDNVRKHLPEAARQLKNAGVARAEIGYDGCGDSGQIEGIRYVDGEGKEIHPIGQIEFKEEAILDLFYDLLEVRHPGWENNDGAFGEFAWDLLADSLTHTHNYRFTEFETEEHEGL